MRTNQARTMAAYNRWMNERYLLQLDEGESGPFYARTGPMSSSVPRIEESFRRL